MATIERLGRARVSNAQFLEALRTVGPSTAPELAPHLQITPTQARRRLQRLAIDGRITATFERRPRRQVVGNEVGEWSVWVFRLLDGGEGVLAPEELRARDLLREGARAGVEYLRVYLETAETVDADFIARRLFP